ncbi:hypothetical protein J4Q44_G00084070, partial [Coregonus suidteri]
MPRPGSPSSACHCILPSESSKPLECLSSLGDASGHNTPPQTHLHTHTHTFKYMPQYRLIYSLSDRL